MIDHLAVAELAEVVLERVVDQLALEPHPRVAPLPAEAAGKQLLHQCRHLRVRGMEGVPAEVEHAAAEFDRPAQAPHVTGLFQDAGRALISYRGGEPRRPRPDDQQLVRAQHRRASITGRTSSG